jgi:hypothetical protein
MLAYVDLDGTLADFDGAMKRDWYALSHEEDPDGDYDHDKAEKIPYLAKRLDLIKSSPDWWRNLEPIDAGFAIIQLLKESGFKIHVLTRASKRFPMAWEQKVRWCNRYLPPLLGSSWGITITTDKSNLRGDVLVDDWPGYVTGWLESNPGGLVLMPRHRWNANVTHERVVPYSDFDKVLDQAVVSAVLGKKASR